MFELSPSATGWTETVLYSFDYEPGEPVNGLIMDSAGNLYGTTCDCGNDGGAGSVFELSPSGGGWTEQTIYNYVGGDAGLAMDGAGNIFVVGYSAVFELSPNGSGGWYPNVIHTFTGYPDDGSAAHGTPVLDRDGNLYGATTTGGAHNYGTVYKLSPGVTGWTEKILHSFKGGSGGSQPWAGPALDSAGNIYGTTVGLSEPGEPPTAYQLQSEHGGASYKIRTLWVGPFDSVGGVILDNIGNLYGTSAYSSGGSVYAVNPSAAVTTTSLTSSPNPSPYGETVIFTAVVTSSAGAPPDGEVVTFEQGQVVLGTATLTSGTATLGLAKFPNDSPAVGVHVVRATYAGDLNFASSASNTLRQVVAKAATTAALVSSQNPSSYGEPVTLTATVTPQFSGTPTGSVKFYNGTATLGFATLSGGVASYTTTKLGASTESITAEYRGNSLFDASTSTAVSQVVNQASTTTTLVSSLNPSSVGQSVTFTATVAPQFSGTVTGKVSFYDGTTLLKSVSLSGGEAGYTTSKLAEGTHTITATYDGSTDFTGSSASLTQTVN